MGSLKGTDEHVIDKDISEAQIHHLDPVTEQILKNYLLSY